MELKRILAVNLRALMDDRGYVEARVAELAGIGTGSVWRALHDQNITFATLQRLAKPFKLSAWALLLPNLDPTTTPIATTQEALAAKAAEMAETLVYEALDERRRAREQAPPRRRGSDTLAPGTPTEAEPAGKPTPK